MKNIPNVKISPESLITAKKNTEKPPIFSIERQTVISNLPDKIFALKYGSFVLIVDLDSS